MSICLFFKVKAEGAENVYISVGGCHNVTNNLRAMLEACTGIKWKSGDIGMARDIVPKLISGDRKLQEEGWKYKQYEAENGWGTVEGCDRFLYSTIYEYERMCKHNPDLAYVTHMVLEIG